MDETLVLLGIAAAVIYALFKALFGKLNGPSTIFPKRDSPPSCGPSEPERRALACAPSPNRFSAGRRTITGKAYVIDGDGIEVAPHKIRLVGLDAPEIGQPAKDKDGLLFDHGRRVWSALMREIAGKYVRVTVEGYDKYGRVLGIVTYNGKDVGAWLVRSGYAIAAYGDNYKNEERAAREAKCGMWGYAEKIEPRTWRDRRATQGHGAPGRARRSS